MRLIVFCLVATFVATALAGIEPMSSYKDSLVAKWNNLSEEQDKQQVDNDYANKFNQFRQLNGLQPLIFIDDLNRVAALRLEEIKINFSHSSAGNYNQHLGENITEQTLYGIGILSNSEALDAWKNSYSHRENMLNGSYRYTSYAIGGGYAIQIFSKFDTFNGIPQLPPNWHFSE